MMKKIFLSLILFCSAVAVPSAEPPAKVPNRFLFVVETSSSMNRSAKAAKEVVRELIESGVQGQMRPGDSFSLWTFNEKLNAEFPLQRWMPEENKKLAAVVENFLKQRRFEKKSQLQTMLPPLYSVIKSSKAITVILISTGNQPIQGTPFDQEINGVYPIYARELRDAKIPFVTTLVGRYGRPVAYSVNSSVSIQIPNPPINPAPVVSQAKTNSPVKPNKLSAIKTNEAAVVKPIVKENIIISQPVETNAPLVTTPLATEKTNPPAATISSNITPTQIQSPVSIEKRDFKTASVATTAIAQVEVARPVAAPSIIATQVVATPEILSQKDERIVTVEHQKTSAPVLIQPSSVAYDDPKTFKPEAQDVSAVSKNMPKPRFGTRPSSSKNTAPLDPMPSEMRATSALPISPVPIAVEQTGSAPKKLLFLVGLILIVGLAIVFIVQKSRNKSHPSLISRSMDQRPK